MATKESEERSGLLLLPLPADCQNYRTSAAERFELVYAERQPSKQPSTAIWGTILYGHNEGMRMQLTQKSPYNHACTCIYLARHILVLNICYNVRICRHFNWPTVRQTFLSLLLMVLLKEMSLKNIVKYQECLLKAT